MASRPWIVAPHHPLEQVDENLWCVDGEVPGKPYITRRMQIVRRSDGTLLFHNGVPVDDATLEQLRSFGKPAVLVVPAVSHTMDIAPFAEKLGLEVHCPPEIRAEVEKKVPVTGDYAALAGDPVLTFHILDGINSGEAILEVRSPDGTRGHLVTCDAILNLKHTSDFAGLFMRYIGRATGGPRVGPFFRWRYLKDKPALRAHLQRIARLPGLTTLVPSHGDVLRGDVERAVLVAASLL